MAGEEGLPVPDDRQLGHYLELHFADSLDGAVEAAERWARHVLSEVADNAFHPYPDATWFARQIRMDLAATRRYIAWDEAHKAAWYAVRLGHLINEARLRGYLSAPPRGPVPPPGAAGGPEVETR
jgi:hypothetical protein